MNQILTKNLDAIKQMCINYDIDKLYAFGSVCNENFNVNSDIDILVFFKNISIEKYTENYFELHRSLELTFDREIDLITNNRLKNPFFIEKIEQSKVLLYAA